MITVTYEDYTIKAIGHANYVQVGKDIVCAGVSILTYTLVSSLAELTEDEIEVELESGKNIIKFKENPSKRAQLLIDSFFIGIQALVAEYPGSISRRMLLFAFEFIIQFVYSCTDNICFAKL